MTNAYSTVVGEVPDLQDEEDLSEGTFSTGRSAHVSSRECALRSFGFFT